ncbi:hypothetical protein I6N90_03745 [Paenibacillus sp. GSMTC-2017]|uniref:coiled-coil domain-containing protein n=1 Tax=Paenibacillus sp. GSMTC-2017 TaxID=2794350 RepID=UPI0018D72555|nr:hypothetical protein [Paenibacillus sp. GSMTC-2017]MBH5316920.1 hypothetical protein [Paenibacillus sp. GSMTC-2017]
MTVERIATACIVLLVSALFMTRLPIVAEQLPTPTEDVHSLLEKSLSVIEIDKEISRIQSEKQTLLLTMTEAEKQLAIQEQTISNKREQAGDVLRAYYMGERDQLYSALLTSKSWSNFFRILDYIDIIVSQDKHTLNEYIGHYEQLKNNYGLLEGKQAELIYIEQKLQDQKKRVLALESDLAGQLDGRSDSDKIKLMIEELTSFWEKEGLSEVREYFKALSTAMGELPSWIQDNKDLLEIKGFQYTIRVPEDKLNAFLIEQDEKFKHFSFQFKDNKITASGKRDNIEISITGQYSVENEPVNGILFHVDELVFNGFVLPDTTRAALEEEFDLGFYPGLILEMLKAKSVEVKDGELIIKLSITL